MNKLRLFTPGPVPIAEHIRALGGRPLPYNRTDAFSAFTHEILRDLKYVFQTEGSVALLTGSGTAAMEASVLNFLHPEDKVLVINGGTFGQRWCDLCGIHSISFDEYTLPAGEDIDLTHLSDLCADHQYTALVINAHETSTGQLYDIQAIGKIARAHGALFMVDAISTICADPFFMDDWQVDVAVLSSQKALALPPGLAFVAMNQRGLARLAERTPQSLYFNLKDYLANQERGQLPYTPAIGLMLQLHQRLLDIQEQTLPALVAQHKERAASFRLGLEGIAFDIFPARSSNAMTALSCEGIDAFRVVEELRRRYNIVVAPNAGPLKSHIFRIAHMGAQEDADQTSLTKALKSIAAANAQTITERTRI